MKNFFNFFFSFDKLFKEKLVPPFFLLALVVFGLAFFAEALDTVSLDILAAIVARVNLIASFFLSVITIRIIAELMVAIFRINDNLSPDKGKSELADYDPMGEARKAADFAAARTREATKTVSEKASGATKSLRENVGEMSDSVQEKAKSATASVRHKADDLSSSAKEKTESVVNKVSPTKPATVDAPEVKISEPAVTQVAAQKKRGRPAGSKNTATKKAPAKKAPTPRTKPAPKKPAAKTTGAKPAPKKRGPKPGSKAPRDADGNLLKKDGTPRKKPGPKPK